MPGVAPLTELERTQDLLADWAFVRNLARHPVLLPLAARERWIVAIRRALVAEQEVARWPAECQRVQAIHQQAYQEVVQQRDEARRTKERLNRRSQAIEARWLRDHRRLDGRLRELAFFLDRLQANNRAVREYARELKAERWTGATDRIREVEADKAALSEQLQAEACQLGVLCQLRDLALQLAPAEAILVRRLPSEQQELLAKLFALAEATRSI